MSQAKGKTTILGINGMIDVNDIDGPLQEIKHMAEFAAGLAAEGLNANDAMPGYFQIPTSEGNQLAFCCNDILRRIEELMASVTSAAK
jgi:hypothetical protein